MKAISIIGLLLLAMNVPTAVALHLGLKLQVIDTNCKEEVKSVRHNRIALKAVVTLDAVLAVSIILISIMYG